VIESTADVDPKRPVTWITLKQPLTIFVRQKMQAGIVTILIRMQLLPDSVEQGKQAVLTLARTVRKAEPDCLAIELAHDMDDPTKITMIEKWSGRDAYEGPHMQSPHMRSFVEQSSKYFAGPPDISFNHGTQIDER
jgi:quinol monooxygenase YgiN